jgi:HPr kinase/phosphorylase
MIRDNALEILYVPADPATLYVASRDVNRPGLMLAGHDRFFDPKRVQFLGLGEYGYLNSLTDEEKYESFDRFLGAKPCCVIVTRGLEPLKELLDLAKVHEVPVLRSNESTSGAMSALISYLGVELAERITRHGVLVEVYGEGILLLGDSGIGKSETAIELVKRGHRLIADDAVMIKKVSAITLVGSAPKLIKHFIELRGIGIVDVRRIFGMGSVKESEKIDLVINFENWEQGKMYDRFGLDTEYTEILGIKIPSITVPVKPGRNLAVIIEIAAMNNRQKKMGYNTAAEFEKRLREQEEYNDD